ncbi:MAG: hypothetical protein BWY06_02869 [Candidatus Latescibacteria bacterium ADurb.Bin168]|nr:MAG: hypothetical protein BWY06_02869 [Candidatus Latescibacteria bacterium ADurb.Bin168]
MHLAVHDNAHGRRRQDLASADAVHVVEFVHLGHITELVTHDGGQILVENFLFPVGDGEEPLVRAFQRILIQPVPEFLQPRFETVPARMPAQHQPG